MQFAVAKTYHTISFTTFAFVQQKNVTSYKLAMIKWCQPLLSPQKLFSLLFWDVFQLSDCLTITKARNNVALEKHTKFLISYLYGILIMASIVLSITLVLRLYNQQNNLALLLYLLMILDIYWCSLRHSHTKCNHYFWIRERYNILQICRGKRQLVASSNYIL